MFEDLSNLLVLDWFVEEIVHSDSTCLLLKDFFCVGCAAAEVGHLNSLLKLRRVFHCLLYDLLDVNVNLEAVHFGHAEVKHHEPEHGATFTQIGDYPILDQVDSIATVNGLFAADVELFEEPLKCVYVRDIVINYKNGGVRSIIAFFVFAAVIFYHEDIKRIIIPKSDGLGLVSSFLF